MFLFSSVQLNFTSGLRLAHGHLSSVIIFCKPAALGKEGIVIWQTDEAKDMYSTLRKSFLANEGESNLSFNRRIKIGYDQHECISFSNKMLKGVLMHRKLCI